MAPLLYLDTARLGQMSPAAQAAHQDFARLAGEVGASIQFDDFLWHGLETCPAAVAGRYPGLAEWKGIASLKQSLCQLTTLPSKSRVLFAGRLTQLMKLAATALCRICRNVLVTSAGWPPYHRLLEFECRRTRRRMTNVELGSEVFERRLDQNDVVELVRNAYLENRCDGLLLSAVSHLGIRLPVQEIVRQIQVTAPVRLVVVDGAQDFCHAGSDLSGDCADLYLAGAHKWLGAFHPLGLAFYGKRRSRRLVETVLGEATEMCHVDDPLLQFVGGVDGDERRDTDETVNLMPLFSCQGAIGDATANDGRPENGLSNRLQNAEQVAAVADSAAWNPQLPHLSLQSGILLLQSRRERIRSLPAEKLRAAFHRQGVALTAYERGQIRLSMPATPLPPESLNVIAESFREVA